MLKVEYHNVICCVIIHMVNFWRDVLKWRLLSYGIFAGTDLVN